MPEDVACEGAVGQEDGRGRGGGERRTDLEDELSVSFIGGVENEGAGDADRGVEFVDAWGQGLASKILAREVCGKSQAGGGVVCCISISEGLVSNRVGCVDGAGYSRREASDAGLVVWIDAELSSNIAFACTGDRCCGNDAEGKG